jgi:hypothetical protein
MLLERRHEYDSRYGPEEAVRLVTSDSYGPWSLNRPFTSEGLRPFGPETCRENCFARVEDLPHRGQNIVRSLSLTMHAGASTTPDFLSFILPDRAHDRRPPMFQHDVQHNPGGGAEILSCYRGLRRLRINLITDANHVQTSLLSPPMLHQLGLLRHLSHLHLDLASVDDSLPAMPSVRCLTVRNAQIMSWSSFPNLVELRMVPQSVFVDLPMVPWLVLVRLEHLTYTPPSHGLNTLDWTPGQCKVNIYT